MEMGTPLTCRGKTRVQADARDAGVQDELEDG